MADNKRKKFTQRRDTSSEEEEEEEEEEDSPPPIENKFTNDGSFLEMFKKKMAEQELTTPSSSNPHPTPHTETEDGETQLKAYQVLLSKE